MIYGKVGNHLNFNKVEIVQQQKEMKMKEDKNKQQDPQKKYEQPPYPGQEQKVPGTEKEMSPKADHGEKSYKGSGKLEGKKAIITYGDSGIGRAVAIAFAREGADVLISYLSEDEDAKETAKYIEEA
ncbi:SDR family NAD(P)-dependent oxidoreductase [Antarcticibacterium sp. 1MA-6-2]|uniref:SDR family NAD(P)-dependent oxidoreductase n=1 Tax=Antarcticibacterium sp. 1MA-6-2 TaxID=2908210 RepID=UPI0028832108|nr:SDR family NAD(P)-dependent oxidoreductase [Antarcticibacterium sp. 1MA-6-2]